jgi:hypothetical protein
MRTLGGGGGGGGSVIALLVSESPQAVRKVAISTAIQIETTLDILVLPI